ncbi:GFA family protein [Solimonas terrae]|uniref:GFA family protein n=1 Tax=Solimonas terrae TaxID=1396819 RepID=A0A6M2BJK1_9GAMM|nr:GFA family protein [Solimonas terrae]NGY03172.1 GFA family protein [Solimonas terrae]
MKIRHAACNCGRLRLSTHAEPTRISICHCLACQQRTGSAFGIQARFAEADVQVEGQSTEYLRIAESGDAVRYGFCPICGSTLFYRLLGVPGTISVPVGGFADPDFPAPTVSIYEEHRHRWLVLPDGIQHEY